MQGRQWERSLRRANLILTLYSESKAPVLVLAPYHPLYVLHSLVPISKTEKSHTKFAMHVLSHVAAVVPAIVDNSTLSPTVTSCCRPVLILNP